MKIAKKLLVLDKKRKKIMSMCAYITAKVLIFYAKS